MSVYLAFSYPRVLAIRGLCAIYSEDLNSLVFGNVGGHLLKTV